MDPIDRRDAIRIVDSIDTWQAGWRGNAIESLKALPSAQPERCEDCKNFSKTRLLIPQPERKTGKWIDETFKPWGLAHYPYKCDQCGEHNEADSNFCPNCGADMRREGEQE